jgi:hypothetical protein
VALQGFHRRPDRVRAVAFMEGHVRGLDDWADFDAGEDRPAQLAEVLTGWLDAVA